MGLSLFKLPQQRGINVRRIRSRAANCLRQVRNKRLGLNLLAFILLRAGLLEMDDGE